MQKKNTFIYIAIITLLVSAFSFGLGWLQLGEFLPRLLFVIYALLIYPYIIQSRPFFYLFFYYFYIAFAHILAGVPMDFVGLIANFMEMGIPIIIMNILIRENNDKNYEIMGGVSLGMTFVTIIASLIVITYVDPYAIRNVVALVVGGESALPYFRMGVADYSMAAMVMAIPCILIGIYKHNHNKKTRMFCVLGSIIAVSFMYKASVTTTFLICLFLAISAILVNDKKTVKKNITTFIPLFIVIVLVGFPLLLDLLSNVVNEDIASRSAMLNEFQSSGTYDEDEDLGARIRLYGLSLTAFIRHPLFGNAAALVGHHAYVLDILGLYGLLGTILHFSFVISQCKMCYKIVPDGLKIYYLLMLLGVLALAFLKNIAGFNYWSFMFLYYPCILFLFGKGREKSI